MVFSKEAREMLKIINFSCPLSSKLHLSKIYDEEGLTLETLRKHLPLASATIHSACSSIQEEQEISPVTLIKAFGGENHILQTKQRIEAKVVFVGGKLQDFIEFMTQKGIYLDNPKNIFSFTLFDTLLLCEVGKVKGKSVELIFPQKPGYRQIRIINAFIPGSIEITPKIRVWAHFGTVISPHKPGWPDLTSNQLGLPFFGEALEGAPEEIDCTNFCPGQEGRGMNLFAYLSYQFQALQST